MSISSHKNQKYFFLIHLPFFHLNHFKKLEEFTYLKLQSKLYRVKQMDHKHFLIHNLYFLFRYLSRLFQISVSNVSDICHACFRYLSVTFQISVSNVLDIIKKHHSYNAIL